MVTFCIQIIVSTFIGNYFLGGGVGSNSFEYFLNDFLIFWGGFLIPFFGMILSVRVKLGYTLNFMVIGSVLNYIVLRRE